MTWRWLARSAGLAGLAAVAMVHRARAQAPADRAALQVWRDSIEDRRDTAELATLEAYLIDSARTHRDDALLHLRIGIVAVREGELTRAHSHFNDAGSEFNWVRDLHADWPWPWLGLGFADASSMGSTLGTIAAMLSNDPAGHAAGDFVHAATIDSTWGAALAWPAASALERADPFLLRAVLKALRTAASLPVGRLSDVELARARIESEMGFTDSALAVLDGLVTREPNNADALLELARVRLESGLESGAAPWYRGLVLATGETLAHYRNDVAMLLPDSTLAAFDNAPSGQARATLMRHFWEARDELQTSSERLREHYRRLDIARREFAIGPAHSDRNDLATQFDDRGLTMIRHGLPDDRASLNLPGVPANESWRYRRPHGTDLWLHFVARAGTNDYRLIPSVFDILALSGQARIAAIGPDGKSADTRTDTVETFGAGLLAQTAQELLHSREPISPLYGKMLADGKSGAAALQAQELKAGEANIAIALNTDSWKLTYQLPIAAAVEFVAIGGDSLRRQLQATFAIPGDAIVPDRTPQGFLYTVRARVAVLDASGAVVATLDTSRAFLSATWVQPDGRLLGRFPLDLPPGAYTVRAALESVSGGMVSPRDTIDMASFAGPGLALSDLALGDRSVPLAIHAGDDTVWIDPDLTFHHSQPLQLAFQVGGMAAGTPYKAQLTIVRTSAKAAAAALARPTLGGSAMLRLGFDERHPGGVQTVHRQLSLEKLNPGVYIIEVIVSTADGGTALRRREFTIVK